METPGKVCLSCSADADYEVRHPPGLGRCPNAPATRAEQTIMCETKQHGWCYGFINPLRHGPSRPCRCSAGCHDEGGRGNPRDYDRALAQALKHSRLSHVRR